MIKDSAKGAFDVVLVWKLDRFARNRYDSAYYKNTLKKNGVRVVSVRETIAEGAEGILLEAVLEGYAEFFSAELAEKVTRGMKENALKGLWNGGNTPFGYTINAEHKLDIDPIAAPIVEEIYKMCYDGMTIKQITRVLEERKITRRNGKPLLYNAVRYILSNRVYIGEFNHMGVKIENGTPRIVSDELFNGAQAEIAKNAHAPARHTAKDNYLLTTNVVYANGHTKSKFELKQPYQCKAKSREKIILAAFTFDKVFCRFTIALIAISVCRLQCKYKMCKIRYRRCVVRPLL